MQTIAILLLLMTQAAFGGDFTDWYFKFHTQRLEISGTVFSPDNVEIGKFTGISDGSLSEDGAKFTETFSYLFMPENREVKTKVVWSKAKGGVYRGVSRKGKDVIHLFELKVKDDQSYSVIIRLPDGVIVESEGRLGKDLIITTKDVAKDKEGKVMVRMEYRRSKAADIL